MGQVVFGLVQLGGGRLIVRMLLHRHIRPAAELGAQAGELLVDDLRVRPGLVALLPRRLQLGLRYRHLVEPLEALQFPLVVAQVTARLSPLGLQPRIVGTLGKNAVTHRALIGARLRQGNAVRLGVDLGEHLAALDRLVALHVDRHQRAADVGGQRDHVDLDVGVFGGHVAVAAEYQP